MINIIWQYIIEYTQLLMMVTGSFWWLGFLWKRFWRKEIYALSHKNQEVKSE